MPPRTSLSHCLSLLTQVVPQDLPTLTQELPGELIEQALAATGTAIMACVALWLWRRGLRSYGAVGA